MGLDCALKTKSTGDKTEVAFEDTVRTTGIILQLQADAAKSWSISRIRRLWLLKSFLQYTEKPYFHQNRGC